jgi:septum formation protein
VRVTGNALVIAADTVVWVAGRGLGKPAGREEAREMLHLLRGVPHEVYTGIAVASPGTGRVLDAVERTSVRMRSYSEEEIEAYLDSGEPLDKAGAYGIQGLGALLVEGIEGDWFNVMGLPLRRLAGLLGEFEEIERASAPKRAGARR